MRLSHIVLSASFPLASHALWYEALQNVLVIEPGNTTAQAILDEIGVTQSSVDDAQFAPERYAILLTPGTHDLSIQLGYYMSLAGVGQSPADVVVNTVYSADQGNSYNGGSTQNFWRSAEGLTVLEDSVWAASQACPLRRITFESNLALSENGGYSSGGFIGDCTVGGSIDFVTQQQYLIRNSELSNVDYSDAGWNYVFVGTEGAPEASDTERQSEVTTVDETPSLISEKPYLVERDNNAWSILVPPQTSVASSGTTDDYSGFEIDVDDDVFVAVPSLNASQINAGIAGKQALLLTPGIYEMDVPISITASNFVVLGIGFATLVSQQGQSAMVIDSSATGVRVASVLLEAGTSIVMGQETAPLLKWGSIDGGETMKTAVGDQGQANNNPPAGVLTDIFARVGAFSYETSFHPSCLVTRADVMVEINVPGVVLDNTWFWHADHDDCNSASNACFSANGMVVNGANTTVYGLKVEHTMQDLVVWNGEGGRTFMFQSELPYDDSSFGTDGYVGYKVSNKVLTHEGHGLGVYIIGGGLQNVHSGILAPATAVLTNMLTLVIAGSIDQFQNVLCLFVEPGSDSTQCFQGTDDQGIGVYLPSTPELLPEAAA